MSGAVVDLLANLGQSNSKLSRAGSQQTQQASKGDNFKSELTQRIKQVANQGKVNDISTNDNLLHKEFKELEDFTDHLLTLLESNPEKLYDLLSLIGLEELKPQKLEEALVDFKKQLNQLSDVVNDLEDMEDLNLEDLVTLLQLLELNAALELDADQFAQKVYSDNSKETNYNQTDKLTTDDLINHYKESKNPKDSSTVKDLSKFLEMLMADLDEDITDMKQELKQEQIELLKALITEKILTKAEANDVDSNRIVHNIPVDKPFTALITKNKKPLEHFNLPGLQKAAEKASENTLDESRIVELKETLNDLVEKHHNKAAEQLLQALEGEQEFEKNTHLMTNFMTNSLDNSTNIGGSETGMSQMVSDILSDKGQELLEQLKELMTQQIKIEKQDESFTMKIQLKPEQLGQLRMQFSYQDGELKGQIFTQNQQVREFIQTNLVDLKNQLGEQGLEFSELDVSVDQESNPDNPDLHKFIFNKMGRQIRDLEDPEPEIYTQEIVLENYNSDGYDNPAVASGSLDMKV